MRSTLAITAFLIIPLLVQAEVSAQQATSAEIASLLKTFQDFHSPNGTVHDIRTYRQAEERLKLIGLPVIAPVRDMTTNAAFTSPVGIEGLRILEHYAKSNDLKVATAATEALEHVAKNAERSTATFAKHSARRARDRITRMGVTEMTAPQLVSMLVNDENIFARPEAEQQLKRMGKDAIDSLTEVLLKEEDLDNLSVISIMQDFVQGHDKLVADAAIAALTQLQSKAADRRVRLAAQGALETASADGFAPAAPIAAGETVLEDLEQATDALRGVQKNLTPRSVSTGVYRDAMTRTFEVSDYLRNEVRFWRRQEPASSGLRPRANRRRGGLFLTRDLRRDFERVDKALESAIAKLDTKQLDEESQKSRERLSEIKKYLQFEAKYLISESRN